MRIDRRTFVLGVAGAAAGWQLTSSGAAAAQVARPSGKQYVRFEDLYSSSMGDSRYALQKVVNKVTDGRILTLPSGLFLIGSGGWDGTNDGTFKPALWIPKTCGGLVGSGRGALGSTSGTVIRCLPETATNPNVAGSVLYAGGSSKGFLLKNFHLEITSQGRQAAAVLRSPGQDGLSEKLTTGIYVWNAPGSVVEDVLVTGWYGNHGAPPGETFGVQVIGSDDHVLRRVECDGRRSVGGPNFGSVGFTSATSKNSLWDSCYAHHTNAGAAAVLYQTIGARSVDCRFGDESTDDGKPEKGRGLGGVNHERTAGTVHVRPDVYCSTKSGKVHFFHSNNDWALRGDSVRDGSLRIVDPTWNKVWGNSYLYIETWGADYDGGSTQHTAPQVTRNGKNFDYKWARWGVHHTVHSLVRL